MRPRIEIDDDLPEIEGIFRPYYQEHLKILALQLEAILDIRDLLDKQRRNDDVDTTPA